MFLINYYKKYLNKIKKDTIFNKIVSVVELNHNIHLHEQQKVAAMALICGNIIDMKTGEGKTFSGIIAACYLALKNRKVHIVSANDYLAERDFNLSQSVFRYFNVTSSYNKSSDSFDKKQSNYNKDIVYGVASTFVFDYLREKHVYNEPARLGFYNDVVIIDEADAVLIDQATSPFSNSKSGDDDYRLYLFFNDIAKNFVLDLDFEINKITNKVNLTESGYLKIEDIFVNQNILKNGKDLYLKNNIKNISFLINSIKANYTLKINKDYVILNDEIIIIDSNTGRLLTNNQRWSGGLHQAVEAKEGLKPRDSQIPTSSISFQNFFKKYKLISAMSGTAKSDSNEYFDVYNLKMVEIPTCFKNKRIYRDDLIFINKESKLNYLVNEILLKNTHKRPILIAATSVLESEEISSFLNKNLIKHNLINAKNLQEESDMISKAGQLGQITVCTNMTGRGTDIVLGNDILSKDSINEAGGLFVIGYGRSYYRRVDEQLSGRCARQGDNGEVQFLLSFDDDLASNLPKKHYEHLFELLGVDQNSGINNIGFSKSFLIVQNKKNLHDLENRKNMILYDDIIQEQRDIYYHFREKLFEINDIDKLFNFIKVNFIKNYFFDFIEKIEHDEKSLIILKDNIRNTFFLDVPIEKIKYKNIFDKQHIKEISDIYSKAFSAKFNHIIESSQNINNFNFLDYIKISLFSNLDNNWFDYNQDLEILKNNIKLRATANIKPVDEFTEESFNLFEQFLSKLYFKMLYIALNHNHYEIFNKILEKNTETSNDN